MKRQKPEEAEVVEMRPEAPPLEAAFRLLEELDKVRDAAIAALLKQRAELDEQLVKLGYREQRKFFARGRGKAPARPCPMCGSPDHDKRHHRFDTTRREGQAAEVNDPPT